MRTHLIKSHSYLTSHIDYLLRFFYTIRTTSCDDSSTGLLEEGSGYETRILVCRKASFLRLLLR
jgi:hypothetical protein